MIFSALSTTINSKRFKLVLSNLIPKNMILSSLKNQLNYSKTKTLASKITLLWNGSQIRLSNLSKKLNITGSNNSVNKKWSVLSDQWSSPKNSTDSGKTQQRAEILISEISQDGLALSTKPTFGTAMSTRSSLSSKGCLWWVDLSSYLKRRQVKSRKRQLLYDIFLLIPFQFNI